MSQRLYKDSPFGEAIHPHLLVADTKFNTNGLFHVNLKVDARTPEGARIKAEIDEDAQAAFDAFMASDEGQKLKPAERAKWAVYKPYEEEEDDDGNPTGYIIIDFKQNATIRMRDGNTKMVEMAIADAAGKRMRKEVGNGSVIRVRYSPRDIPMKSLKQVGIRLDFAAVQVRDYVPAKGGGTGFGAVEGYEDDGTEDETKAPAQGPADGTDY